MRAMIMAAGVGNRLMPLTANLPKPMVLIVNNPVMEYNINLLKENAFNDVLINLHYLPHFITNYFKGNRFGIGMHFSIEETLLGTAGGVKNNEQFLNNETFVVLSGDCLTDIDLSKLINFHKKKGALATIALKRVNEVSQYGVVVTDNDDRIIAFQEKPKPEEALSNLINTGVYVFEPSIFELIPKYELYDFGRQLFPQLVQMKAYFYGYDCSEGYWKDIGNIKAYKDANIDLLNNKVKTGVKYEPIYDDALIGKDVIIEGSVIIGQGCIIGNGAKIKDSIILPGAVVKESQIIEDSIYVEENMIINI